MTKIWTDAWDSDNYTEARILHMEMHLDVYMAVMGCKPMTGWFPNTTVRIRSEEPPTDYFNTGGMFIVSDQIKSILNGYKVHAEFFPLQILYQDLEYTERGFYFCNILDCIDCFDFSRGDYTFSTTLGFSDRVDQIRKLAIDQAKAASYHLFRIAKGGEYIVCASDELARRITEANLTGMKFVTEDQYP